MSAKPKILVFASGDAQGGGSGFQEMVEQSRTHPPILDAEIVGVVSNHPAGGVFEKSRMLGIPFKYWAGPFTEEGYQGYVRTSGADYVMLSGWLKMVRGLDPGRTINIHPGPLPAFGGPGMYGHHVHEAVMAAYTEGKIMQSAVTVHFVNTEYDRGPTIFRLPVMIRPTDTPETLARRVNEKERAWQSYVLNLVVHGYIYLHEGRIRFLKGTPMILI